MPLLTAAQSRQAPDLEGILAVSDSSTPPPASEGRPASGEVPSEHSHPGAHAYDPAPSAEADMLPPQRYPAAGYGQQVVPFSGPVGRIRSTGLCILLSLVTFGIYSLFWFYAVHSEMKRHSNQGLDGGIAAVLAFFVGIVMPYITSNDIGNLYERRGMRKPVSAATGLWYFPGVFILVGPIVWFVKTNGAVNAYWRSLGAVA